MENKKELDFLLHDQKIAIEYNGHYFHSNNEKEKDSVYHLTKHRECEKRGYRLIHIFENEYLKNKNLTHRILLEVIKGSKWKIDIDDNFQIKTVLKNTKEKFHLKYNLFGDSRSDFDLGCYYKNRLIRVLSLRDKDDHLEIVRDSKIRNFETNSLKLLLNSLDNDLKIVVDKRWSDGKEYLNNGFILTEEIPPKYHYFSIQKTKQFLNEEDLKDIRKTFDPSKSEWENMKDNGYDRIWDCGHLVFEKTS